MEDLPAMLAPVDLARLLRVNAKTVSRWSREGRLDAIVTPGGHRRYPIAVVLAFLREMGLDDQAAIDAVRKLR